MLASYRPTSRTWRVRMAKRFVGTLEFLDRLWSQLGVGLLFVSVACATAEVVTRYVLGFSTAWVAEVSKYAVVVSCFLLAGPLESRGKHIRLSAFEEMLGAGPKRVLEMVSCLIGIVAAVYAGWYGMELVAMQIQLEALTDSHMFQAWWFTLVVPISMWLLALHYVGRMLGLISPEVIARPQDQDALVTAVSEE